MNRFAALCLSSVVLSGCQTSTTYEPFIDRPENFEIAKARCELMAQSSGRSMVAFGSATYVGTMQIANSLDNAARAANVFDACMRAQGWRQAAYQPQTASVGGRNGEILDEKTKRDAITVFALLRVGQMCGLSMNGKGVGKMLGLMPIAPADVIRESETLALKTFKDKSKLQGKAQTCAETKILLDRLNAV